MCEIFVYNTQRWVSAFIQQNISCVYILDHLNFKDKKGSKERGKGRKVTLWIWFFGDAARRHWRRSKSKAMARGTDRGDWTKGWGASRTWRSWEEGRAGQMIISVHIYIMNKSYDASCYVYMIWFCSSKIQTFSTWLFALQCDARLFFTITLLNTIFSLKYQDSHYRQVVALYRIIANTFTDCQNRKGKNYKAMHCQDSESISHDGI